MANAYLTSSSSRNWLILLVGVGVLLLSDICYGSGFGHQRSRHGGSDRSEVLAKPGKAPMREERRASRLENEFHGQNRETEVKSGALPRLDDQGGRMEKNP